MYQCFKIKILIITKFNTSTIQLTPPPIHIKIFFRRFAPINLRQIFLKMIFFENKNENEYTYKMFSGVSRRKKVQNVLQCSTPVNIPPLPIDSRRRIYIPKKNICGVRAGFCGSRARILCTKIIY